MGWGGGTDYTQTFLTTAKTGIWKCWQIGNSRYNVCYRAVQIMFTAKTRLANFRAQNCRAIMDSDKFNCRPYQVTNVVNLSLKHTQHYGEKRDRFPLMFRQRTKHFHSLWNEIFVSLIKKCNKWSISSERRKENGMFEFAINVFLSTLLGWIIWDLLKSSLYDIYIYI